MKYLQIFFFSLILLVGSCKDEVAEQLEEDIQLIENYLEDNNLAAEKTSSGLHFIITKEGTGAHPTINDSVKIKYKGYTLDGSVFNETQGASSGPWPLTQLIEGWQEGIPKLKKGGTGVLLIPSKLGYGSQGQGSIAPNTVLIFDVELIDF